MLWRQLGFSTLFMALCFILTPAALTAQSPTISAVAGSIAHDQTISISGANFGSKTTPAPIIFDNFDNGSHDTAISPAAGWSEVGYSGIQIPRYDNGIKHAGNGSMKLFWDNWQSASSVKKYGNFAQEFYFDGWFRYDQEDGPPWSRVVKLLLLFGDGAMEYPQIHYGTANCTQNEGFHIAGYAGTNTSTSNAYGFNLGDVRDRFRHMQLWLKASSSDQYNGSVRLWLDGQLIASSDSYLTVAGNHGRWNHVRVGYYHAHDGIPGCDPSPGDAYGWWDNVYIDNTQARVEIGNASTYNASTHREIQIPSSWSASSLQARINQGSFPSGQQAWLYVVNSSGAVNAQGYPITFGGSQNDSVPPGAPLGLRADD